METLNLLSSFNPDSHLAAFFLRQVKSDDGAHILLILLLFILKLSFREEVCLITIRQGWREVPVLVLAMESQMTILTWKSWERLPPCPWVPQKPAFHIFQQREPWDCEMIVLKMMLSLLPLLHFTSCGTLATPSQLSCCAFFSSPKSMHAWLVAPHHTPSR